jgi:hypothetical protein
MKPVWPILIHFTDILLENLRRTVEATGEDSRAVRDLNQKFPELDAHVPVARDLLILWSAV